MCCPAAHVFFQTTATPRRQLDLLPRHGGQVPAADCGDHALRAGGAAAAPACSRVQPGCSALMPCTSASRPRHMAACQLRGGVGGPPPAAAPSQPCMGTCLAPPRPGRLCPLSVASIPCLQPCSFSLPSSSTLPSRPRTTRTAWRCASRAAPRPCRSRPRWVRGGGREQGRWAGCRCHAGGVGGRLSGTPGRKEDSIPRPRTSSSLPPPPQTRLFLPSPSTLLQNPWQATKHHPSSVDLELIKRLAGATASTSLTSFLAREFDCVSRDLAGAALQRWWLGAAC